MARFNFNSVNKNNYMFLIKSQFNTTKYFILSSNAGIRYKNITLHVISS